MARLRVIEVAPGCNSCCQSVQQINVNSSREVNAEAIVVNAGGISHVQPQNYQYAIRNGFTRMKMVLSNHTEGPNYVLAQRQRVVIRTKILLNMICSCTLNGNENHDHSVVIDGIMPIAAIIDCSALLATSGALNKEFRGMVTGDINQNIPGNLSRLGSSIPFENDQMLDYFENMKNNWDPGIDVNRKKVSLILGWFMYQPLKKSMSEVYRKLIAQGYHYDSITN